MYSIKKKENIYSIDFVFNKQKANVTIEIYEDDLYKIRLVSNTDGYHWLQFFLCQTPNTEKMLYTDYNSEIEICKALFFSLNIIYEQEDKESAWLTIFEPVSHKLIKSIAGIIEPRFANREKFSRNKA